MTLTEKTARIEDIENSIEEIKRDVSNIIKTRDIKEKEYQENQLKLTWFIVGLAIGFALALMV